MKILLILLAMLLVCYACGSLITSVVSRGRRRPSIAIHIGYAYVLVFFYLFFALMHSASSAAYVTLGLPLVAGSASFLATAVTRRRKRPAGALVGHAVESHRNDFFFPLAAGILIAAFAIWPYVLVGWGNYWHSGNEDIEDGLRGRDAYLEGRVFGPELEGRAWFNDAGSGALALNRFHKRYTEMYAEGGFRLQYSSLAFWSALFNSRNGMDIFLEQATANLLLMAYGLYCLSRRAFSMSAGFAAIAAAASGLSAFYLGTFFAGHQGSLMYGALVPALLYLALVEERDGIPPRAKLAYASLIAAAIAFTYPHPLAIISIPVLTYRLLTWRAFRDAARRIVEYLSNERTARILCVVAILALTAMATILLWHLTAGYRLRQANQYRAWGYAHDWVIIPLFLGLIPPPSTIALSVFTGRGAVGYWGLVAAAGAAAAVLAVFYGRFARRIGGFLPIFGVSWVLSYVVFRFFIVDSYYLYKFLYTHQFLIVIGLVGAYARTRSAAMRVLCGAVVVLNVVSDVTMAAEIYSRPYNHDEAALAELYKVDSAALRNAFVDLPGGAGTAVREGLRARGIEGSLDRRAAEYFIVSSDGDQDGAGGQLSETIARPAGRFLVKRAPAKNYLMIGAYYEPEKVMRDQALPGTWFRWVGMGRNDYVGIDVVRPDSGGPGLGRYLRVCLQSGPSAMGSVPVAITGADNTVLERLTLEGIRCAWIPAQAVLAPPQHLIIRSGVRGKSILPFDDRILLYRVFAIGWTDEAYDDRAMSLFNLDGDITSSRRTGQAAASPAPVRVRLGQGWQALEMYRGERFRWAGRSAELVVDGNGGPGVATVELALEPGPSLGRTPLRVKVQDEDGKEVFESNEIHGRGIMQFPVRANRARSVYVLRSNSEGLSVRSDPRILNYRVFAISVRQQDMARQAGR